MFDILKERLHFPQIHQVKLYHFSLYSLEPTIIINVKEGVLCLVGANGLGKSTFLNSINFALTGIIPRPNKEFVSVDEFYRHNQHFAEEYFLGRIVEDDYELAEITLEFVINEKKYTITRGLFEPNQLRHLSILSSKNQTNGTYSNLSQQELNEEYKKSMTKDIGIESFDQFVFLQWFVFTFDERRELLFWNNKVIEQSLYLAFGIDFTEAKKADILRRDSEKADSLGRNYSWQASAVRKQIENLQNEVETAPEEILAEIKELYQLQSEQREKVEFLQHSLENYRVQLYTASSQLALLRDQYEQTFQSHLLVTHTPLHHPLIVQTIQTGTCGICGTENASIATSIQEKVNNNECPLCGTSIVIAEEPTYINQLRDLDAKIEKAKAETEEHSKATARISGELEATRTQMNIIDDRVNKFELANPSILSKNREVKEGIEVIKASYENRRNELLRKKEESYAKRDLKRAELAKLQKDLERSYFEAEIHFVPLFKDLAYKFLGLELDIILHTTYPNPSVTLILKVRGTARREQFQLSESQKFFVDIALRMALAIYISKENSKATLFIDTPEGSLDIAYESRAGEMFASFIDNDHNIIMSANINSSQLLRQLAARCGKEKMQVTQMTQWAELSEVQIQEEHLFEKAYQEIEKSLNERTPIDRL